MSGIAASGLLIVIVAGLVVVDVVWDWLHNIEDRAQRKADHDALMREIRRHP